MHLWYTPQAQLAVSSYRAYALCGNTLLQRNRRLWLLCHFDTGARDLTGGGEWGSKNNLLPFSEHTCIIFVKVSICCNIFARWFFFVIKVTDSVVLRKQCASKI